MADIYIPKGDKGFNLNFTVQEDDGTAYNLATYTITLKIWPENMSTEPIVDAACTPIVAASGTCYYTVTATDFTSAGDYILEIELTKTGVIESTRHYTLKVEDSA